MNWPAIIAGSVVCGFLGLIIGGTKGLAGFGFFLGLALGPLGLLICLVTKPTPAVAAARAEAIEVERVRIRAQREEAAGPAAPPDA